MELSKHIKAYDSWLHHAQWSAGVPLSLIPSVILSLQEIIRGNRGKDLCDSLLFKSQHQIQRKAEVSEKKSARIDLHEVTNLHADCRDREFMSTSSPCKSPATIIWLPPWFIHCMWVERCRVGLASSYSAVSNLPRSSLICQISSSCHSNVTSPNSASF